MARFEMGADEMVAMAAGGADGQAYFELGCMYAAGRSVEPNLVTAHKWFNVAASRGHAPAVARRAELACEMNAADISAAQREARLWLTRH